MKPTLSQVFTLSLVGLFGALALLFYVVLENSRATLTRSSERIRDGASREIEQRISRFLVQAPETVAEFQLALNRGLIAAHDPKAYEPALFVPLLANREIGEITLTYGHKAAGAGEDGALLLDPGGRGQISVWRAQDARGEEQYWSRHVYQEGDAFVADRRELKNVERFTSLPVWREQIGALQDPTAHATFTKPASEDFYGQLLWSDLHWSQLDAELPEEQRRVEVSVQQVVTDSAGTFAGVLRVGLLAGQLDEAVQLHLSPPGSEDPHRIFICDAEGGLITRGVSTDRRREIAGDVRIPAASVTGPIAAALAHPALRAVSDSVPAVTGHFQDQGEDFLSTFRILPGTQDWIVGIVVPRAFYLGELKKLQTQLLLISLAIMLLLLVGGFVILGGVRRAQAQIARETGRMNAFEFSPAPTGAAFRDVSEMLESLEKAKSAMRAMGKYVPIDLVRRLYREKSEPALGGEEIEVSLMFTDIANFTALAEALSPNELAAALGRYLETMGGIIQQETHGTIDKYIGDAIMTFWNAPEPVPEHAQMACQAALRCREEGERLFQSAAWRGLPPFPTRFGLHRDIALVGHFGAPDRINYTAIGDAVNLASRLEGLNKQYGTAIIASERIFEAARARFDFRLLDLVAVKGKLQSVKIYELRGRKGEADGSVDGARAYEAAFHAYLARDFAGAMSILARHPEDPPSRVLIARCRAFQLHPPPAGWEGVHVSEAK